MVSDKIIIKGLKVPTIIGVHPWEQKIEQTLIIDLELETKNVSQIAKTDDLEQALDYQKVAEWIQQYGKDNSHKLIETFAANLADGLAENFQVPWIKIELQKHQAVENTNYVGITIERSYNL